MRNLKSKRRIAFSVWTTLFFLQACLGVKLDAPPTAPGIESATLAESTEASLVPTATIEALPSMVEEISPTPTSLPKVVITAVKGNLFIRRGPNLAYNPISVLYKGTSATVIAHDVLLTWAQVIIPNSEKTGWVSVQTEYSKVTGDLNSLPGFMPTDWPVPAYLKNCTYHGMYIMPGKITLPSLLGYPENQIWLYPGKYKIYDYDVPGRPEVMRIEVREGSEFEILDDGLGVHKKCPVP